MTKYYGDALNDPAVKPVALIDAAQVTGKIRHVLSMIEIPTTGDENDTYALARIPSSAFMSPQSKLYHDAFGTAEKVNVGSSASATALLNTADVPASGSKDLMASVGIENYTKRAWEVLGFSEDPGGEIEILLVQSSSLAATSTAVLSLFYALE